jgi:hypothetical protein
VFGVGEEEERGTLSRSRQCIYITHGLSSPIRLPAFLEI